MPEENEKIRMIHQVNQIIIHERNTLTSTDRTITPPDIFITGHGWVEELYVVIDEEPEIVDL